MSVHSPDDSTSLMTMFPDGWNCDPDRPPSVAQFRAARALVDWSQDELAAKSGVGRATVGDFERGARRPMRQNLAAMRRTLEGAGVAFVWSADGGEGVVVAKASAAATPHTV